MIDVRDIKNTNIFIILTKDKQKRIETINKLMDDNNVEDKPLNGIEWSRELHKYFPNDLIFDCAIANYDFGKDPMSNIDNYNLLTRRVNTLVMTALNDKDNTVIPRSVISKRADLINFFQQVVNAGPTGGLPYSMYKQYLDTLLPQVTIIESSTSLTSLIQEGLLQCNKPCIEVVGIKNKKFSLIDGLQITLAVDKDRLANTYDSKTIEQIKSVGYIEPHIAVSGCINQALASITSTHHPLALLIHTLQHYLQYPDTDAEMFKGELDDLFQSTCKEILPMLTSSEISHISDYIYLYLRKFKIK